MSAQTLWIQSPQTLHCTELSFFVNFLEQPKQLLLSLTIV
jgi:hypothetical protein